MRYISLSSCMPTRPACLTGIQIVVDNDLWRFDALAGALEPFRIAVCCARIPIFRRVCASPSASKRNFERNIVMNDKKVRTLTDFSIPIAETARDAASKGLLSPDAAERWILADEFVQQHRADLVKTHPGKAIAVTVDEGQSSGFATYLADSDGEAVAQAVQFSSESPFVLIPIGKIPIAVGIANLDGEVQIPILVLPVTQDDAKKLVETDGKTYLGTSGSPYTTGAFVTADGKALEKKNYLIDTGASLSAISEENLDKMTKAGAKLEPAGDIDAQTGTGKAKIKMVKGGAMSFKRTTENGEGTEAVVCDLPVMVIPRVNILGVDQLKKTGTMLNFDPAGDAAELKARPKPKKK
jgi:hypothetical protein